MRNLKIPYHRQQNNFYCGPASLQMALAFFKYFQPQTSLARQLKTSPRLGTNNQRMVKVAQEHGFASFAKKNSKLSDIKFFLKNKLPVIINYREPSENEYHFALISGLDDQAVRLADPHNGHNFKLKKTIFLRRWRDSRNIYKKWFMVIAPKKYINK
ncbi:MAG: hypothetical protein C3F02_02850 [Parcubacteria group bacterium]|nr:MAG: hypothetical protein C3F02_02850 [Parcubacteria group bacterium]